MKSGFVYFIRAEQVGLVKIGFSADPARRIASLAGGSPLRLDLTVRVSGTQDDERFLHHRFKVDWSHGEWFRASDSILSLIETIKVSGLLPDEFRAEPRVEPNGPACRIIQIFGGVRATARAMALPASTVQSWKDSGYVPAKHQGALLIAARELSLSLSPEDFFDLSRKAAA